MKTFLMIILILAVLAWCPWLKPDQAQSILNAKIIKVTNGNRSECPMKIRPETLKKVLFGYKENVYFDCTGSKNIYGIEKSESVAFITFYKDVIGLPAKKLLIDN